MKNNISNRWSCVQPIDSKTCENNQNNHHQYLIQNIATGDKNSLAELYRQCVDKVYSLAYHILQNSSDAEDITCEIFIEIWNNATAYNVARGSVMGWLLIKCRSRAIDLIRKQKNYHKKIAHIQSKTIIDNVPEPEDLAILFQSRSVIRETIELLSKPQRQILFLAFYRGYSRNEIASHLNLPLGSVKSHISRAFTILREHLNQVELL